MPKKVGSLAAPDQQGGQPVGKLEEPEGGAPFLKAAEIPEKGGKITLLGNMRTAQAGGFSDYLIDVRIGKETRTLGLKRASGNYRRLFERFGSNPAKWKGAVKVVRAVNMGKEYVQVQ